MGAQTHTTLAARGIKVKWLCWGNIQSGTLNNSKAHSIPLTCMPGIGHRGKLRRGEQNSLIIERALGERPHQILLFYILIEKEGQEMAT